MAITDKFYHKCNISYLYKKKKMDFITIAVFHSYQEIIVLKSILENRNIPHLFENETLISVDPMASLAYGGIRLKIHGQDRQEVQEILDDLNSNLKIV